MLTINIISFEQLGPEYVICFNDSHYILVKMKKNDTHFSLVYHIYWGMFRSYLLGIFGQLEIPIKPLLDLYM